MDLATFEQLLSPAGQLLLGEVAECAGTESDLALGTRLRKTYATGLVAAAVTQNHLRGKGISKFGDDAASGQGIVEYDGALSTAGGNRVESRRFVATAPADGTGASVGPALNRAANQVARDVAGWVGNSGTR